MPITKTKLFLRRITRTIRNVILRLLNLLASRKVVTPYTGFILSTHFLSRDILDQNLRYLNRKSRDLSELNVFDEISKVIIWCQTNQIDEFTNSYLDLIKTPFILITGRDHWSKLELNASMKTILSNRYLIVWFAQNQIMDDLPIRHFPYGVNLNNSWKIYLEGKKRTFRKSIEEVHIPFCTIHKSNDEVWRPEIHAAMLARESIKPKMGKLKKYKDYITDLRKFAFVLSPMGDRPDTYRHWEILYLGGVPVTNLPKSFSSLFGENMIFLRDFNCIPRFTKADYKPNKKFAKVKFWSKIVNSR